VLKEVSVQRAAAKEQVAAAQAAAAAEAGEPGVSILESVHID
jgi:hypothetical protein